MQAVNRPPRHVPDGAPVHDERHRPEQTTLHRSRLGLHIFAVGANAHSAGLNGLHTWGVVVAAYGVCSLLAVVAGIYLVLLWLAAWLRPQLLSLPPLLLILRQAAPLGLAVMGQSLVMRARSIDLSVGGVIVAVSYILTSGFLSLSTGMAMLACVLLGVLVGAIIAASALAYSLGKRQAG